MSKFEIQDISKVKKRKCLCSICYESIIRDSGCYRVKYGSEVYHVGCFYKWLSRKLKLDDEKRDFLLKCEEELRKFMPQILAENIINN